MLVVVWDWSIGAPESWELGTRSIVGLRILSYL